MKTPLLDHETGEIREVETPGAVELPEAKLLPIYAPDSVSRLECIRELVTELRDSKTKALEQTRRALVVGHRIGTELIAAHGALEQGTFDCMVEASGLEKDEVAPLVKLAKTFTVAQLEMHFAPAERQALFALGFVPEKDRAEHEGDERIKLAPGLGAAVNSFRRVIKLSEAGRLTFDREKLRFETKPIFEFLREIHEGGAK